MRGCVAAFAASLVLPACGGEAPQTLIASVSGGATSAGASSIGGGGAAANDGASAGAATLGDGGRSTGGTASSAAGAPAEVMGPPRVVLPCPESGAAIGQWANITPQGIPLNDVKKSNGAEAFVINPKNSKVVYLGSDKAGIYKSEDCGGTWTHVDVGSNGTMIDTGAQWTMAIDHEFPDVLYTNSGYGANGLWKSSDAGKNWTQVLPPDVAQYVPYGGFIERITVDPAKHDHVIVSFHAGCTGPWAPDCLAESTDAGANWHLLKFAPGNAEGTGQTLIDGQNWFFGPMDGLWRTKDGGATWNHVYKGYASDYVYRGKNGTYFSASEVGVISSDDGDSWSLIPNSPKSMNLVGDGESLFTTTKDCPSPPEACQPYSIASESSPGNWQKYPAAPGLTRGGWLLKYDPDHNLLYSSNEFGGFWRVQTK